jgi:septal ring factor EnvC (AmiA/AmiB activator)
MPVFDEEDKGLENEVKYPLYPPKKAKAEGPAKKRGGASTLKKIPVLKIGLVLLIAFAVAVMFSLAARMSTISDELRQMKTQLGEIQGSVSAKIEASNTERHKLKAEITEFKSELGAIKTRQRHLADEAESQRKAAEVKKKVTVVAAAKKNNSKGKRP